ncbi:MAG: HIT domain-containing protein [Planctomycetes bacterium]|nr:HIT domain-containing protein [Planctomycetota bacterium]
MENLWAPWRMEFITSPRSDGCIFCTLPSQPERLRENLVLHIGRRAFVMLNRYPYTCGHLMVVPRRHTSDYLSLTAEENAEATFLLQQSMRILGETYRPEGFNLGMNLGHAAGAGIREHLHHHLIPRWFGDSNFWPIVGEARSMPEMLLETYDRLRPLFEAIERPTEDNGGRDSHTSGERARSTAEGGHDRRESGTDGPVSPEETAPGGSVP